jgi:intein/homing endonuclease
LLETKPVSLLEILLLHQSKQEAYAYLLGLYLGDGHIIKTKSLKNGNVVYKFRIFQDAKYINLIQLCAHKMKFLFESEINIINKPGCVELICYKNNIPEIFPQHGAGKKHKRKIALQDWQKDIIRKYPKEFIKGLIHSDGCRYVIKQSGHEYVKYELSNRSQDILEHFDWACSLIGVDTRRHSGGRASILRTQKDVEIFQSFIGPKS